MELHHSLTARLTNSLKARPRPRPARVATQSQIPIRTDSEKLLLLCFDQGVANPNPMSPKLHCFATKTGVRDSLALGLEADRHEEIVVSKFERKKLAKVRTTFQKEKYFEKLANYVPRNSTQSPIT